MSYYGNNNSNQYSGSNSNSNWNSRPGGGIEEVDLSSGGYPPAQSDHFAGPGAGGPPAYGHPNQQPPQAWQRPGISGQINAATTKHYNDFLEQQGIPAISPEDMQILRECGRESLYFRCLPLTAALCGGLVFAARTRPNFQPKWLHYMGATFLGYFVGKVSYRGTCETKLINSRSNSPFVNAIRKKRGLYVEEFNSDGTGPAGDMPAFESDWTTQGAQSSSQSPNTYGIGEFDREEKPQPYSAWNSRGGGNNGGRAGPFGNQGGDFDDSLQDGQPSGRASSTSYDDLRQRNRATYKG